MGTLGQKKTKEEFQAAGRPHVTLTFLLVDLRNFAIHQKRKKEFALLTLFVISLKPLRAEFGEVFSEIIPARGKDLKNDSRTFTAADRTSIRDVIAILKSVRHHVASRRIRDFLEVFFMLFSI